MALPWRRLKGKKTLWRTSFMEIGMLMSAGIRKSQLEPQGCAGEPQLDRRNLYRSTGGDALGVDISARLWMLVLNLSDGEHSLLDIAERSGMPFSAISDAEELL
jgi:aminopeptidase-like protein